jgi:formate hydrogenlyase subunit 4
MIESVGRLLLILGVALALLGLILIVMGRTPFLGRLPGDIHIRRGAAEIYIPLATCILLSILATLVLNLLARFLRK